jgi:septal ring factor EnvC (AmiA/AmiB activator)
MFNTETVSNVVEFVKVTGELMGAYQEKVASLEKELSSVKSTAQKEAGKQVEKFSLDAEHVTKTVDKMAKAGFIRKIEKEAAIDQINTDPATLLSYLDKLADRELSSVKPIAKASRNTAPASSERESDKVFEECFRNLRSRI